MLLAFTLVLFFGPLGLFYAGVGWGFLGILFSFIFFFLGCGVALLFGGHEGWIEFNIIGRIPVIVFGILLAYGTVHLISMIVSPVVVYYQRQHQLDELEESEALQNRTANRYRPKKRHYSSP